MSEVIRVRFGEEYEWEETHQKLISDLVATGSLYGDNEALMRAEADCAYEAIRRIVEHVPAVEITVTKPEILSAGQCELITESFRRAAIRSIDAAITHSVEVVTGSLYDLCTSKLAWRPQTVS